MKGISYTSHQGVALAGTVDELQPYFKSVVHMAAANFCFLLNRSQMKGRDITLEEFAGAAGTNAYEILTGLTARLPRVWSDCGPATATRSPDSAIP